MNFYSLQNETGEYIGTLVRGAGQGYILYVPARRIKTWAEKHENVINIASSLYELNKNKSVHASGIVICNEGIQDSIPLELDSQKNIVCGYTMNDAQKFSIKFDNLGVKSIDVVKECLEMVGKKIDDINIDDKSIYEFLNSSNNLFTGILLTYSATTGSFISLVNGRIWFSLICNR